MFKSNRYASRLTESSIRKMFEGKKEDDIAFAIGQPDYVPPSFVRDAMKNDLQKNGMDSYGPTSGIPELRDAIANDYNERYGLDIKKDNVVLTSGASEALNTAINTFMEPGYKVLITDPSFLLYPRQVLMHGGTPVCLRLEEENNFRLNPDSLQKKIEEENPHHFIINYPSNPTGTIPTYSDLKKIANICEENNVNVISDEVYDRFYYEGKHTTMCQLMEPENVFIVNSFSKILGMCGSRLGYFIMDDSEETKPAKFVHQATVACPNRNAQVGVLESYKKKDETEEFIKNNVNRYKERRDLMVNGLNENGIECYKPNGAFYVFPSVKKLGLNGDEFAEICKNNGVLVVPGKDFGPKSCYNVRMSFATSENHIEEGVKIMGDYVRKVA